MDIWPDVKTEGIGRGLELERVASQSPVGGGLPWSIERGVTFTAGTKWKVHIVLEAILKLCPQNFPIF